MSEPRTFELDADPEPDVKRALAWLDEALQYWGEPFREAREDYDFYNGKQWKKDDLAELERQKRPALTINLVFRQANLMMGQERSNRTEYKAIPKGELHERALKAEDLTQLLHAVYADENDGDYVSSEVFQDGISSQWGWWECTIGYHDDPIDGEVHIGRVPWDEMLPDPLHVEYDTQDGRFLIRLKYMDKDAVTALWPDQEDAIDGALEVMAARAKMDEFAGKGVIVHDVHLGDLYLDAEKGQSQLYLDPHRSRLLVAEVWYREYEPRQVLVDRREGTVRAVERDGRALAELLVRADEARYHLVSRTQPVLKVLVLLPLIKLKLDGGLTPNRLADGSPDPEWPYVRFSAYWADGKSYGLIRQLKDPQREKNKRRSQELHILNTSAKSGWKMADNALAAPHGPDWLREHGSETGVVIVTTPTGFSQVEPIKSENIPALGLALDAKADQEAKDISGINASALGEPGGRGEKGKSGVAMARQQAMAALQGTPVFDNFHRAKRNLGRQLVRRLQQAMTVPKMVAIAGQPTLMLNQPDGDAEDRLARLKNDPRLGKYEVQVVEAAASPTTRIQHLLQLRELAGLYKEEGVRFPIGLLVEATDLPPATKERLMGMLPAELGGSMQPPPSTPNPRVAATPPGAIPAAGLAPSPAAGTGAADAKAALAAGAAA